MPLSDLCGLFLCLLGHVETRGRDKAAKIWGKARVGRAGGLQVLQPEHQLFYLLPLNLQVCRRQFDRDSVSTLRSDATKRNSRPMWQRAHLLWWRVSEQPTV